jgi:hypothetical protein
MTGEWRMENGEWRMENGEWRMENGEADRENIYILIYKKICLVSESEVCGRNLLRILICARTFFEDF